MAECLPAWMYSNLLPFELAHHPPVDPPHRTPLAVGGRFRRDLHDAELRQLYQFWIRAPLSISPRLAVCR